MITLICIGYLVFTIAAIYDYYQNKIGYHTWWAMWVSIHVFSIVLGLAMLCLVYLP